MSIFRSRVIQSAVLVVVVSYGYLAWEWLH
jgi:hypothetical protein